jgi:sugar phosphate isomerase/epimerase
MRLLFVLLVAGLGLTVVPPVSAAEKSRGQRNDAASEKLGIKLALQCYTFREVSFFETVDLAAKMGIKYLEIYPGQKLKPGSKVLVDMTMDAKTVADIKRKLAKAGGLKLVAYGVAGVPNDETGARKMYDWAKEMGIEVLVTETTPNQVHDQLCQEYGIRFALHNHPASWPPNNVLKACQGKSPLIGSCADTGHWVRAQMKPVAMLRKLEGRIESLHFKDLNQYGNGHDVPWGTGVGDARGQLAELKRQGFKGYLSIEYEHGSVKDLLNNLPRCIQFFDKVTTELAE